jgi:NTE family protein
MLVTNNKKIGYALGGGAARGLSHIGVLKVLDEHKIFPDLIAGTSMGAVIGALYASGLKAIDIEQVVLRVNWKRLMFPTNMTLPLGGITQGKRVISLLKSILGDITFSRLQYDFVCVTTDIITGEQVVLRNGSLIDSIRASMSIPGIFTPVMIDGRYLVDGGLVNEVPVSVCRVMGAGYVIGVNVIPDPSRIMCNPQHGRNYPACELLRLGEIRDLNELPAVSGEPTRSLLRGNQLKEQKMKSKSLDSEKNVEIMRNQNKAPGFIDVLTQSIIIAEHRIAMDNIKEADIAISPEVEDIGFWQFNKTAQAIEAGEKAARQVLQQSKLTRSISPT